jgi:hypothetical protein
MFFFMLMFSIPGADIASFPVQQLPRSFQICGGIFLAQYKNLIDSALEDCSEREKVYRLNSLMRAKSKHQTNTNRHCKNHTTIDIPGL